MDFESYYFRTNSTQLDMIVANISNDCIQVDVIAAAGGSGVFNWNWGSERKSVNRIMRTIK